MQRRVSLEEMDFTAPVTSREGISADYLARERILYLSAQDRSLVAQTQFADAKGAALITLMGLLALKSQPGAALSAAAAATAAGDATGLHLLDVVTLGVTALSIGFCLWAIIPRYPTPSQRDAIAAVDRYSWPGLVTEVASREAYVRFMLQSQHSQLVACMARSNSALSGILLRKYRALRIAFLFGLAALVLVVIRSLAGA